MFIREIHIEGFGIFHDQSFAFSPRLNVICGPNEAGKSTLLAFIHQVLFGFLDRRSKERTFEALKGGRLGGRLVFEDETGGRYTIERFGGARGGSLMVRLPDGNTGSEETLRDILGNTTRDVFCKIFAFGLDQLQVFSSLQDDGVRSHIYSAGTGGISISAIESQLSKKSDALFRPRASKSAINELLKNMEQQSQELKALSGQSQEYDRQIGLRTSLEQAIETGVGEIRILSDHIGRQERYRDAWEPWRILADTQTELAGQPRVDEFPEDGKNRLSRIEETVEGLQRSIAQTNEAIELLSQKTGQFPANEDILKLETAIESLRSDRNRYAAEKLACTNLEGEVRNHHETWRDALRDLGQDWTEEKVASFNGSVQTQEEVRQFKDDLARLAGGCTEMGRQINTLEEQAAAVQEQVQDMDTQDKNQGALTDEVYREKKRAFQKLSLNFARYSALSESALPDVPGISIPGWPFSVLILLGVAAGLGFWQSGAPGLGALSSVVFLIAAIVYRTFRNQTSRMGVGPGSTGEPSPAREACEQDLRQGAARFNLGGLPTDEEMLRLEEDLDREAEVLVSKRNRDTRKAEMQKDLSRNQQALERLKSEHGQMEENRLTRQKEWELLLGGLGLSKTFLPDSALLVLSEIKTARDRLKSLRAERERLVDAQREVDQFEAQVKDVFEALEQPEDADQSVLSRVDFLTRQLDQTQRNRREYERLAQDLREQETNVKHLNTQLEAENEKRDDLLRSAGVEEGEAFIGKHELFLKRQVLLNREQRVRQELERLLGVGDNYTQAIGSLEQTSLAELMAEIEALRTQREDLQAGVDEKRESLGGVRKSIADVESQKEASALRQQHRADCEKLNVLAEEWASWMVARSLMAKARDFYERERRPGVIKEAESIFAKMTNGVYTRVHAPLDGSDIQVGDGTGAFKGIEALSRGTAEQLYLSV
ncbi:MAG: AAA family ATPase, partial [bacterium]|nr:AAA family ATPase [bacterium]